MNYKTCTAIILAGFLAACGSSEEDNSSSSGDSNSVASSSSVPAANTSSSSTSIAVSSSTSAPESSAAISSVSSSLATVSSSSTVSIASSSAASTSGGSALTPTTDIVISEVVTKSADQDYLQGNDWIELYNAGSSAVNLSDYALADNASGAVALPSVDLPAGEYVVIAAADQDDEAPPAVSVPFKLGSEDSVSLSLEGEVIDQISWIDGDIPDDGSLGVLDGTLQALTPTPGQANTAFVAPPVVDLPKGAPSNDSALVISEVVPQSDRPTFYEGEDWLELRNDGDSAVDLSSYSLADSESDKEPLPALTLEPGDTVVVIAGGTEPTDNTPYVPFKLGREDSLSIFEGEQEVRYLAWTNDNSKNGRSYGYLNGELAELYPTPNYGNVIYNVFNYDEVYRVDIDITAEDWEALLATPTAEEYYPVDFTLNGAKISNVGFRTKGQGSLNFIQNSTRYGFKVDMNEYVDQKFMGLKKLVFSQSFSDPSFMRDNLSYKLMRDAGVAAPESTYVDLWISGEHHGLYQMVEMIDTEFLEKHFPDDSEDLGDLYKGEIGQRLQWVDENIASYNAGLVLKTNEATLGTPEEGAALLSFLNEINNGTDPLSAIDVEQTIRYLAATVLLGNMDNPIGATANNFYLYEQRSKGVFSIIPWDYNLAMGMWGDGAATTISGGGFGGFGDFGDFDFGDFDFGDFGGGAPATETAEGEETAVEETAVEETAEEATTDPVVDEPVAETPETPAAQTCMVVDHVIDNPVHDTNSARPMFDPILSDPELLQQYRQQIQELLDTVFSPAAIQAEVDRIAALIDPYVQADPTKFFTYEEWLLSLSEGLPEDSDISGGRGANTYGPAPGIIGFTSQKIQNVQAQLSGELPSSNNGGTACPL